MFGHDDDAAQDTNTTTEGEVAAPAEGQVVTPASSDDTTTAPVAASDQTATDTTEAVDQIASEPTAVTPDATPEVPAPAAEVATEPTVVAPVAADTNTLLTLKQEALQQLTPLVGHLDQPAEEKFRTTMMMIQAADDSSLVQTAYEAALQIEDEKVRAQALLDIVNEINYFTQNKTAAETPAT